MSEHRTESQRPTIAIHRQRMVVVRECLWCLVGGDFLAAAILGQMIYWSLRTRDIDKYLEEEAERLAEKGQAANVELTHGWVYKTTEDLTDELMHPASSRTVARRLDSLVETGFLEKRHNPDHGWDRTLQYRPDLEAIDRGLRRIGYSLENAFRSEDWKLVRRHLDPGKCIGHDGECIGQGDECIGHDGECIRQGDESIRQGDESIRQGDKSIRHGGKSICHRVEAIPETTIETTLQTTRRETTPPPPGGGGHNQCIREVIAENRLPIPDRFIPELARLVGQFDEDARQQVGTGLSWVLDAMTEVDVTVENPVRYVRAILKRWRSRGYDGPYLHTTSCAQDRGIPSAEPDPELESLWQDVLEDLQLEMTAATFDTWLRDTHAVGESDGALVVLVKNEYARDWLEARLHRTIAQSLHRQNGGLTTVRYVTPEELMEGVKA